MSAGVVGGFPGIDWRRRTVKGPVNPLDKATIVSICPKILEDRKPTLQPGQYYVPAGSVDKPAISIIGPASWWRDFDPEQPLLEIPQSAILIAESVVVDYCNGIIGCDMVTSRPGWFYVAGCKQTAKGEVLVDETLAWIKTDFKTELEEAKKRQIRWYEILVKMADSLWARSNGNPLAISDDMRLAAKELGLQAVKDWMKDFQMVEQVRCKACGSLRNPLYPVCATCKNVDLSHPSAKELKFTS
jgi:hypothetical protein